MGIHKLFELVPCMLSWERQASNEISGNHLGGAILAICAREVKDFESLLAGVIQCERHVISSKRGHGYRTVIGLKNFKENLTEQIATAFKNPEQPNIHHFSMLTLNKCTPYQ